MTTLEILVEQFFIGRPHAPKEGEWYGWLIYAAALIMVGVTTHFFSEFVWSL